MRFSIMLILAAILTLTGCNAQAVENRMDAIEQTIEQIFDPGGPTETTTAAEPSLTREEAQAIALEHAGLTTDQVTYLHTEYEIDDGVPQYEVGFHRDRWEYDYEINAKTGEIISFSRDD